MKKNSPHKMLPAACLLGLVGISGPANAENWYIGASFGQSDQSDAGDAIKTAFRLVGLTATVEDTDSAWKLFVGYQANENLGFEAAYVDLGQAKGTGGGVTETVQSSGIAFSLVGTAPLSSSAGIFGKVGLFSWSTDISATGPVRSASASTTGTDLTYGVGAKFQFNKQVGARLEWEHFTLSDINADMLSVGILFTIQ